MRYFSSTVTRFDSVGWAVSTGRMRKLAISFWISSGSTPALAASASTWLNVPAQFFAAALALDLAAAAHGGVLLGDGEKLEPDALRLERAGHELGREIGDAGAAFEQRLDLRLMLARHVEQEPEQQLGGFARRCAGDQSRCGRRSPASPSSLTSSFMMARHSRRGASPRLKRCGAAPSAQTTACGLDAPPDNTRATVDPNSLGFGATVRPQDFMISAFSAALSPAAEMMAPAWPMRRPLGAVRPATKPTTGFFMFSLIQAEASASCGPPISPMSSTASVSGSSSKRTADGRGRTSR